MADSWAPMARFSSFSPDTETQLGSTPNYGNGNGSLAMTRPSTDQTGLEALKDRFERLMATETEKNKLIQVCLARTGS